MDKFLDLNGRRIGPGYPVYIIAEISANHHQDYNEAIKLIRAAKEAGADAVKLQTYTPDTLTLPSDKPYFKIQGGTLWDGDTLHDLYRKAYMRWDWQLGLKKEAKAIGIDCFSTPYDASSLEFLADLNMPAYKVASFEIVDLPLIRKIAKKGRPMILSTGMATLEEISEALQAAAKGGAKQVALLKCTSAYPASPKEMNLKSIPFLAEKFSVPIGLSDHTMGHTVAVAAVAVGACILEKHFTLSRSKPGPDSTFSLEPHEFKELVQNVRVTEQALGVVKLGVDEQEAKSRAFRRSLFVVRPIQKGEAFNETNIRSIRPGTGLLPKFFPNILGKKATRNLEVGHPLQWNDVGKKKCIATIEARMASSRLPGKIMKEILGRPLLERLVERVRMSKLIDEVVVATTINPQDDAVEAWARSNGISFFRGSEEDVLLRVLEAAKKFAADIIVELTGDCPLLDPVMIDEAVQHYLDHNFDYVSNTLERTYPRGFDIQVFSTAILDEVNRLTTDTADHEHVSLYIYEHPERYKLDGLKAPSELHSPEFRVCVDTQTDLDLVRKIFENLYPFNPAFSAASIIQFLRDHPEFSQMNAGIHQKAVRL